MLIEKEQFFSCPNLKRDILTLLRSKNVDYEKLARVAIKHVLDGYLQHKKTQKASTWRASKYLLAD